MVMLQAENKKIRLFLSLDREHPNAFSCIVSDRRRMLQILLNFISNSLKFTGKDGFIFVRLKVLEEQVVELKEEAKECEGNKQKISGKTLKCWSNSTLSMAGIDSMKYIKMRLTIDDNGVGISVPNQKRLFSNYMRLEEHQALNAKGTGLGLSICKNIIEQMGGNVTLESELNQGTMFHITMGLKSIEKINMTTPSGYFTNSFSQNFKNMNNKFYSNLLELKYNKQLENITNHLNY